MSINRITQKNGYIARLYNLQVKDSIYYNGSGLSDYVLQCYETGKAKFLPISANPDLTYDYVRFNSIKEIENPLNEEIFYKLDYNTDGNLYTVGNNFDIVSEGNDLYNYSLKCKTNGVYMIYMKICFENSGIDKLIITDTEISNAIIKVGFSDNYFERFTTYVQGDGNNTAGCGFSKMFILEINVDDELTISSDLLTDLSTDYHSNILLIKI